MKKTIILCDRCGKEGTMIKVRFQDTFYGLVAIEGEKKYSDICVDCGSKILWKGIIHKAIDGKYY